MNAKSKFSERKKAAMAAINEKTFTDEEKARILQNTESCIACGGGVMTDQMRQDTLDILEHRKTVEQVREEILQRYKK